MWAWLAGCGDRPAVVDGPTITPAAHAPLSAELAVTTDVPTTLHVELRGDDVHLDLDFPEVAREHVVPLHGTRADRDVDVKVEVRGPNGRRRTEKASWHTGRLPDDLPDLEVLRVDRGRVFDGWLLVPLVRQDGGGTWFVAVDPRDGQVAWSYDGPWDDGDFGIVGLSDRGTLVGEPGQIIVEVDLLGNELHTWADDYGGLNHDVRLQDDELVFLQRSDLVDVPAYPTSYDDPEALGGPTVIEDSDVVTLDAATGAELGRWPLSERLDTARIGWDSLTWTDGEGWDWVHANAVLPFRGGYLVEARHQDALVSLDAGGDVRWILSNPYGWGDAFRPLLLDGPDPDGWPFHPHGPSVDRDGHLIVLDNHNDGYPPYAPPVDGPERSRVVAWSIDDDARTARTAWTWTPPDGLFSNGLGNAAALDSGDVIADFPLLVSEGGVANPSVGRGQFSARVFELEPGDPDPVLDLRISTDADQNPDGIRLYRAIPIPSFWPAGVTFDRR
jgi:hypothetical protein